MGELVWVYHATTSRCVVGSFQIFAGKATTHLARHGRTWPRPESSDQTPTLNLANHIIAHLCKFISAIFNETQKNGRVPQQKQSYKTIKHTYIYIYVFFPSHQLWGPRLCQICPKMFRRSLGDGEPCHGLNLSAEISRALGIDGFLCFLLLMEHLKIGFGESREPIPSTETVPKFFKFNQIIYYFFSSMCQVESPFSMHFSWDELFPEVPSSQKSPWSAQVEPQLRAPAPFQVQATLWEVFTFLRSSRSAARSGAELLGGQLKGL